MKVVIDDEVILEACLLVEALEAVSSVNARIEAARQYFGPHDRWVKKDEQVDHPSHHVFVFGAR